jgi:translation initiation factor 1
MRKGGRDGASAGPGSRLVYSTDGAAPKPATRTPPPPGGIRPAPGKGIRVRLEKRPGGRDVTTVLGLVGSAAQLEALARDLRAACGAGGTVRDGVIELQGDQGDKVRAALLARGIKAR